MPISAARSVPSLQSIRLQVASCLCRMGVMGDASNANDGKADDSFAGWWLGGFGCAGAIVAGVLGAVFADLGFVESAGIVALGAVLGAVIAFRVAVVLVLIAEDLLGWDEQPPASSIGRLYLRLDQLIDQAGL
jgi:hypothetical protein